MVRRSRVGVACAAALCSIVAPASAESPVPTPIGVGPRFHPGPTSPAVALARPVGRFACGTRAAALVRAHVEVFARRRVVVVPAGIGIAPPHRVDRGYVHGGRCSYPLRTREPTGVVELDPRLRPTLGHLFAVWGQRLSGDRLLSFAGRVRVYVAGRLRPGDPRATPLTYHAQIVVQVGGYVPPYASYLFGPGR
jgi:hypothetical protein